VVGNAIAGVGVAGAGVELEAQPAASSSPPVRERIVSRGAAARSVETNVMWIPFVDAESLS
jgi:hypothetical protein